MCTSCIHILKQSFPFCSKTKDCCIFCSVKEIVGIGNSSMDTRENKKIQKRTNIFTEKHKQFQAETKKKLLYTLLYAQFLSAFSVFLWA